MQPFGKQAAGHGLIALFQQLRGVGVVARAAHAHPLRLQADAGRAGFAHNRQRPAQQPQLLQRRQLRRGGQRAQAVKVFPQPVGALVSTVAERIFDDRGLKAGDRAVLLVNNLGATPAMEMAIVAGEAARAAEARGLRVERMWTGAFLTALDMAGFSLSALAVDDELLSYLDAPTTASAWPTSMAPTRIAPAVAVAARINETTADAGEPDAALVAAIEATARALIAEEARLTALDQAVGDGDLGLNLARGAEAVLAEIDGYRALGRSAGRSVFTATSPSGGP